MEEQLQLPLPYSNTLLGVQLQITLQEDRSVQFIFDNEETYSRLTGGTIQYRHRYFRIERIEEKTILLTINKRGILFESGPEYVLRKGTGGFLQDGSDAYIYVLDITDENVVFAEEKDEYSFAVKKGTTVKRGLKTHLCVGSLGDAVTLSWYFGPD